MLDMGTKDRLRRSSNDDASAITEEDVAVATPVLLSAPGIIHVTHHIRRDVKQHKRNVDATVLVDVGSCALHVVDTGDGERDAEGRTDTVTVHRWRNMGW